MSESSFGKHTIIFLSITCILFSSFTVSAFGQVVLEGEGKIDPEESDKYMDVYITNNTLIPLPSAVPIPQKVNVTGYIYISNYFLEDKRPCTMEYWVENTKYIIKAWLVVPNGDYNDFPKECMGIDLGGAYKVIVTIYKDGKIKHQLIILSPNEVEAQKD